MEPPVSSTIPTLLTFPRAEVRPSKATQLPSTESRAHQDSTAAVRTAKTKGHRDRLVEMAANLTEGNRTGTEEEEVEVHKGTAPVGQATNNSNNNDQ